MRLDQSRGFGDSAQAFADLQGIQSSVLTDPQTPSLTDEQGDADHLFQHLDLLADGRMGDMQFFGGCGDAPQPCNRFEAA
ncbi:hypothetical protein O999_14640 [Pseudomonas putida LF54]|nr:hypothetical protein O999_14640 [Pseudomonas putida LF54]